MQVFAVNMNRNFYIVTEGELVRTLNGFPVEREASDAAYTAAENLHRNGWINAFKVLPYELLSPEHKAVADRL